MRYHQKVYKIKYFSKPGDYVKQLEQLHIGNNAVDGSKKSEWKSTLQDKLPVITFKLKHPCMSGIKEIKVSGIITSILFVYVSEDGNRFVEITSVATDPEMNRVDTLNGWSMSHSSLFRLSN